MPSAPRLAIVLVVALCAAPLARAQELPRAAVSLISDDNACPSTAQIASALHAILPSLSILIGDDNALPVRISDDAQLRDERLPRRASGRC